MSELTSTEESETEAELKERKAAAHEQFTKKLTREITRVGEDYFQHKNWTAEKKRDTLIKLIRDMDSGIINL